MAVYLQYRFFKTSYEFSQYSLRMKTIIFFTKVFLLQFFSIVIVSASSTEPTKVINSTSALPEFQLRSGIPNLLRKARAADGRTIKVGYLGGSITEANGWRVKSLAGFKTRFPSVNWVDINAGVGGTGSDLGVFRLKTQVLDQNPDLLFVEFAVNDGGSGYTQRAMEGIVRQTWAKNPEIDIVFVYTCNTNILNNVRAGITEYAIKNMELVAAHYSIPSIHFGIEVVKRIDVTKDFVWYNTSPPPGVTSVTYDNTHPTPLGHDLYALSVKRGFDEFVKATATTKPVLHTLVTPLNANHWAAAKMIPIRQNMQTGSWTKLPTGSTGTANAKRFSRWVTDIWSTSTAGSTLTIKFKGDVLGFFDIMGPEGCILNAKLDNVGHSSRVRFDATCNDTRANHHFPGLGLDNGQVRTFTLTLNATSPDKRAILNDAGKADFDANPQKYAPKVWYAGVILLVGEEVLNTSVDEQLTSEESAIYPNPTKDMIYINNLSDDSRVLLVDMMGRTLLGKNASELKDGLSLQPYPNGLYMIRVMQGQETVKIEKVIKK
jgi:lysophospholipase L1-like esterase